MLETMVQHPGMLGLLSDMDAERDMLDVRMRNPNLNGRRLRHVRLPGNALIIAVARPGENVIPHGETKLLNDDRLTLVGSREDVRAAADYLSAVN